MYEVTDMCVMLGLVSYFVCAFGVMLRISDVEGMDGWDGRKL